MWGILIWPFAVVMTYYIFFTVAKDMIKEWWAARDHANNPNHVCRAPCPTWYFNKMYKE
jgi:hypothetical protein